MRTWRAISAPIIAEIVRRVGREDVRALRKALREAYPFGPRQHWPYKVWCDEVRAQLGLKSHAAAKVSANQGGMFS